MRIAIQKAGYDIDYAKVPIAEQRIAERLTFAKIQRAITQEEKAEIGKVENDLPQSSTEREQIVKVRLEQSKFRERIARKYDGKCIMSGIDEPMLLIAGHIKPWAVSDETEKLDQENGFLLSATFDKLFDKGTYFV